MKFLVLIFFLLLIQMLIFFLSSNNKELSFTNLPNSVEKFTTMISGNNGVDIIKADKLIKISDEKTILMGEASLKNDEYEISSQDVTVDSNQNTTSSSKETITKNQQGIVISEGFEFDQEKNTIKFIGKSEFHSNEN